MKQKRIILTFSILINKHFSEIKQISIPKDRNKLLAMEFVHERKNERRILFFFQRFIAINAKRRLRHVYKVRFKILLN